MDFDLSQVAQTLAIYALPVLFAITLHEAAHGYVARHFGDMTAHAQGRISLNPMRHIDILGTIVVPVVVLFLSGYTLLFGWAKPVPVNYSALRKPRPHMAWVAAAGPGANLAMAVVWAAVLKVAVMLPGGLASDFLRQVAQAGILVNVLFMFLNLLPILPLDGGRILASLLPSRAAWQYAKLEPLGLPLLVLLLVTNVLSAVLDPLVGVSGALIRAIVL
ncbi:MAG TPA: site-2 protease family protein [Burkholderiales bacterium]|nr:site-2 protease family protein [Burkholderiales bacterium]